MSGFGILMLIFAALLFLIGIYMFTGHKVGILEGRVAFRGLSKEEWKNIGKYTIFVSIFVLILGIIGIIFNFE